MSAVAELEEETAAIEPMRLDVRFAGVDLAAAPSVTEWASVNARRPRAYLEYNGPPIVRLWRDLETPEQRLARVPEDLQQLLIERGRSMERREQAQRDFDYASNRLDQLEMRAQIEAAQQQQRAAEAQAEREQRHREAWLQMQAQTRSMWVGHGVCCTPGRGDV